MPVQLVASRADNALPIHLVSSGNLPADLPEEALRWAEANGFDGDEGKLLVYPDATGGIGGALFGTGEMEGGFAPLKTGSMARKLPQGDWYFANPPKDATLATLGLVLGSYAFTDYGKKDSPALSLQAEDKVLKDHVSRIANGVFLTRDLINIPANDMGPDALEQAVSALAKTHQANLTVTKGDALLAQNFPLIHAVGRASDQAPRLLDMVWGDPSAPLVTLVGKGVCFDTGGLDIKPSSNMLLMKKDMGGAANVIGLASMLMDAKLKIRLRMLIPAVENSISGNAFRPSDILKSRKGINVEIGNTDAEGRLVLADALTLADEEDPNLLIDMATLTGAARIALGPDLPPFYTNDEKLAAEITQYADSAADPLWRMPLWQPYASRLGSKVAHINNATPDGMAGSITAALFLKRFVERSKHWAHFDIFGWSPSDRPHCPIGGEAQGIRALERLIHARYG